MDTDRPQLYYFLLPFTVISLFLYLNILFEIYLKRGTVKYDSFFYRMICSQSLYDMSYVVMYFVMEIPQDWPSMYGFLTGMNGTILPQLIYAHVYLCHIAQCLGVTVMSISRMQLLCYPSHNLTNFLRNLCVQEVMLFHFIVPALYSCYIIMGQDWRFYDYLMEANRLTRVGSEGTITLNSNILCACSFSGAILSAFSHIRVFIALRKRPLRSWRRDISILITSFVLFCALCTLAAYFVCNLVFLGADWAVFYTLRKHFYAFSFFLSLANPWCLMITSESMRSSIVRRCLPSSFTNCFLCSRFCPTAKPTGTGESTQQGVNRVKTICIPSS